MLRKFWGTWLPDRFRQPDYLPPGSVPKGRRKKTLGFASLPHGRFAFIGAITLERSEPFVQVGQTALNICWFFLSTVILPSCFHRCLGVARSRRRIAGSDC